MPVLRQASGSPTQNSITLVVDDLDYIATNYYAINLYNDSTGEHLAYLNTEHGGGTSGNYRTKTVTISGLSSNTTYYFRVNYKYNVSDSTGYLYLSVRTLSPPYPDYPSIVIVSADNLSLHVQVYAGANTTDMEVRTSWGGYERNYNHDSYDMYDYYFNIPSYGQTYTVAAKAYNGSLSRESTASFYSGDPPLSIGNVYNLATTSLKKDEVTIDWSDATNASQYEVQYKIQSHSSYTTASSGTSNSYITINNLSPETYYDIRVRGKGYSGQWYYGSWSYHTIKTLSAFPEPFDWTIEKNSGQPFNVTANEWNTFLSRINQWREYFGYPSYNFTGAYPTNIFFYNIFNEAVAAINTMSPNVVPPSSKSSGDGIYASYFDRFQNSLNSLVNK